MKYIVGIDEVGRGPLAGPVTVGVVVCEQKLYTKLKRDKRLPALGRDSKKLSEKDRQKYAKILKSLVLKRLFDIPQGSPLGKYIGISYVVIHISNKIIDQKGISSAIKQAMSAGLKKLSPPRRPGKVSPENCQVLLDGGLKAPTEFKNQKTIIKGDEKEKIIAWASILAKVSRDSLMCKASKKYPDYGFHLHKGYGTLTHRMAIFKHGFSPLHRKSFCKNIKCKILPRSGL